MVLEPESLRFCCIPHSGNKGYVPICDYTGGKFPVEKLKEARRKLIEQNNSDGDSPCKGCHFLERRDWDAERKSDALLEAVYVSHYSICNLRCRYCYVYLYEGTLIDVGYELLPVIREMIDDGLLMDGAYIEWGGGEPTILKDFPAVQRLLVERGYPQQVSTSGVRFSQELEDGVRAGTIRAVTSIDAGTRETYKKVKGRDKFDVVFENVARYAKTGGDMTVKYILRADNSDPTNLKRFAEKCAEAGVKKIVITPDQEEVAQDQVTEETLYAFALLRYEAKKRGIYPMIRDEYVSPEDMRRVRKYVPLQLWWWRYGLYRLKALAVEGARRTGKAVRRLLDSGTTRAAIRRAQEIAPDDEGTLRELLEHQTTAPHPELRDKLAETVKARPNRRELRGAITTVGVSEEGWTLDGETGFVVVDGGASEKRFRPELVFHCTDDESDLPVKMTIADGVHDDIEFTFLESRFRRIELPEMEPGEVGIFAVRTDKTWLLRENGTERRVGVRVTDMTHA